MHRRGDWCAHHHGVVFVLRPCVSRVNAEDVWTVARNRQRLLAFPVWQCAASWIRSQQIDGCVVPDRGIPTTMNGFSIGIDSISGWRFSNSVQRQPIAQPTGLLAGATILPRISWSQAVASASIAPT